MGISYRVVFRRDPIPSQSVKPLPAHSRPHHVHGAIYLFEEDYRPGAQPKAELVQADLEDHLLDHYSGAVAATCKRHYQRQVSTGSGFHLGITHSCRYAALLSGMYQVQLSASSAHCDIWWVVGM